MKIRTRLILSYLLVAIVPLIFLVYINYSNSRQVLTNKVTATLETIADTKVNITKEYLQDLQSQIAIVQDYYNIKVNLPIITRLAGDRSGAEYLQAKDILNQQLSAWHKNRSDVMEIILTDPKGRIVYTTDEKNSSELLDGVLPDPGNLTFQNARDNIYISDLFADEEYDHSVVFLVGAPVKDFNGDFIGIVVIEINAKELYRKIQVFSELGQTGEIFIVRKFNSATDTPHGLAKEGFSNRVLFLSPLRNNPNAALSFSSGAENNAAKPAMEAVQGRSGAGLSTDYAGHEVLAAWRFIPSRNWGLVAKIDLSEAMSPLVALARIDIIITFIAVIFLILVAIFFASNIARPITALTKIAADISKGNLRVSFDKKILASEGETGILVQTFADMTEKLETLYRGLEKKVRERTAKYVEVAKDLEKFKLAVADASDHIVITDEDGLILYANKAVERITGFKPNDVIGKKAGAKDLWGGLMSQDFYKKLWQTIKSQKRTFSGEINNRRKNGEHYIALASISPVLDEKKRVKFFVGIEQDITSEKKIAEVNERLASIVRDTSEAIITKDFNGKILTWNKGAENIYGYSAKEAIGRDIKDIIIPKELFKELDEILAKAKRNIRLDNFDTRRLKKDGTVIDVTLTVSPVHDKGGKPMFISVIARDVTVLKAIDKAKTEFVSLASHQLRTPLSAINWYAEMLLAGDAGKINKNQKEYMEEIYKGNQRMVALVNALLNVSRIELGTLAIDPEPTKLSDLAKSVVNEMKPKVVEKKLNITEKYDPKLPLISLDPKLARIVLQNYISNAVKYTPEKGKITVEIKNTGSEAQIAVSDNGMGIPKSDQARIFQKLFRADNARVKETDGTGLGLYIVKAIIDQFGGKVWFESAENKGSIFYVTVPLKGVAKKEGSKTLEYKGE
ncbi:MAG: hypothetical protein C3F02_00765 [Parcubacteria group bacterium]|nr:MAG: hypothetical protein C3F02_00765 [Parcubacteria group bacterium]